MSETSDSAQTQEGQQEAPTAPEVRNTYPTMVCFAASHTASHPCSRRAAWVITARAHDGTVLKTIQACNDHRGQATNEAWRWDPEVVELRLLEEK